MALQPLFFSAVSVVQWQNAYGGATKFSVSNRCQAMSSNVKLCQAISCNLKQSQAMSRNVKPTRSQGQVIIQSDIESHGENCDLIL